jgi:SAM-dependent methyltransferase
VSLHPLADRFSAVADAYERGRAEYPPAVVGALAAELHLDPGSPVLDLAAGTGKLTRALVDAGLHVVAVEPQAALREALAARVSRADVRDGRAEAIPLDDASVDAVTVADAFHWFDPQPALAEIRRVLAPGGGLAVLATAPDWSGATWADDVGKLVMRLRPEHPHFDGPPWQESVAAAGGWSTPRVVRVSTRAPAQPERIVDYVASMSWMAALAEPERAEALAQVSSIVEAEETPDELGLNVTIGLTTLA